MMAGQLCFIRVMYTIHHIDSVYMLVWEGYVNTLSDDSRRQNSELRGTGVERLISFWNTHSCDLIRLGGSYKRGTC